MGAEAFLSEAARDLQALRMASLACCGCDLYQAASQTVFGEGASAARLMLVGEQPGDQEDKEGVPFVGPAGAVLDRALKDADMNRDAVYLTNAVKHFKWEQRGSRRLHKTPSASERSACRPWLLAEIAAVRPDLVVCMGATAGQSLLGSSFRVGTSRGKVFESEGQLYVATIHPSAVLRQRDERDRQVAYQSLVGDLRVAASAVHMA